MGLWLLSFRDDEAKGLPFFFDLGLRNCARRECEPFPYQFGLIANC
jgi:hypothetical protein